MLQPEVSKLLFCLAFEREIFRQDVSNRTLVQCLPPTAWSGRAHWGAYAAMPEDCGEEGMPEFVALFWRSDQGAPTRYATMEESGSSLVTAPLHFKRGLGPGRFYYRETTGETGGTALHIPRHASGLPELVAGLGFQLSARRGT